MQKVNPYPGLRPFTEKESIFFKGRDLHIRQIIKQLERSKIIVITGASGDGKSSLVYAGVIPNAKAGFFRAEYNNWIICDFRPERTPLDNLAKRISENLKLPLDETLEELRLGFSSLIRLYKNSPFFVDKNSNDYLNASPDQQRKLKSQGANLFILADQFEEFFTNPENYAGGVPSDDAYITVNLLLESAGLAISEELPVYIVFTMRSDFISQSVSFKGLPEYIGYSQFFVPRLQRNELQQVIEEPAKLAGGSISKRLVESLINELRDGFDQLPIIQYSLSQLWKVAGNGNDEMDLVHLAKLAGLPTKYLSNEDKTKFAQWIGEQDSFKQKYYQNTGLSNVLNTHANILYETAHFYYQELVEWSKNEITEEDSRFIIMTAFQSLTKIDAGRAVRNRVTLREITNIVNRDYIDYETVCGVLNIFRLPGNNFIHPYINPDDIDTQYLDANTILDITHEALIRNWEILSYWETQEKENYSDFHDFKIQLERWINNDRSDKFLLPLGTLVHFENWYNKFIPNKYWIAKYDNTLESKEIKLGKAEFLEEEIKKYLKKSRQAITNAEKARKKRRMVLSLVSLVIILVLSGITYWAIKERKNALIQQNIAEDKTRIAEQQTILAQQEKNKALSATELADQERLKAEQSAKEAIEAKNQSEQQRKYAIFLQILAEDQSKIAKSEAEKARLEKLRADEQRQIAEKAKNEAIVASDSANTLSYLALSRTLALKAQNNYTDPQINLLLAYQAYIYNNKFGGFEGSPDIYNALRYAQLVNGSSNIIEIPQAQLVSFFVSNQILIIHTIDNSLINYDERGKSIIDKKILFKTKVPVNSSYFLSDNELVIGFENSTQVLYFIDEAKEYNLKGHTGLIRAVDKNPKREEFATAGRDKLINIYKLSQDNQNPIKTFATKDRVNAMKYTADGRNLIVALNDGSIYLWNTETEQSQLLEKKEGVRALSIGQNLKRDVMAVGFEDGSLVLFYPNQNFGKKNFLLSNTGIKSIDISSNSKLLSISKENRKIDINFMEEMNQNIIKIMDSDVKVKNLLFSRDDRLYGLCEDNTIRFWEKNNKVYANSVKYMIKRNFTEAEWKLYVGENIKYEKTINK
jgi:hypothetical protein